MKAVLAAALALAFCLVGPDTGYAQSAAPSTAAPAPTPTTKILAIGTINPGVEPAKVVPRERIIRDHRHDEPLFVLSMVA
jgi:hypothetical protein